MPQRCCAHGHRLNQDQPLDEVDFVNLRARLRQNMVTEKLTNAWLTRLLAGGAELG